MFLNLCNYKLILIFKWLCQNLILSISVICKSLLCVSINTKKSCFRSLYCMLYWKMYVELLIMNTCVGNIQCLSYWLENNYNPQSTNIFENTVFIFLIFMIIYANIVRFFLPNTYYNMYIKNCLSGLGRIYFPVLSYVIDWLINWS